MSFLALTVVFLWAEGLRAKNLGPGMPDSTMFPHCTLWRLETGAWCREKATESGGKLTKIFLGCRTRYLGSHRMPPRCAWEAPATRVLALNVKVWVAASYLTLQPKDYSPPGSSVRGASQARTPEWVAVSFSSGSSWPRGGTQVSCSAGRFFTIWASREAPRKQLRAPAWCSDLSSGRFREWPRLWSEAPFSRDLHQWRPLDGKGGNVRHLGPGWPFRQDPVGNWLPWLRSLLTLLGRGRSFLSISGSSVPRSWDRNLWDWSSPLAMVAMSLRI